MTIGATRRSVHAKMRRAEGAKGVQKRPGRGCILFVDFNGNSFRAFTCAPEPWRIGRQAVAVNNKKMDVGGRPVTCGLAGPPLRPFGPSLLRVNCRFPVPGPSACASLEVRL